MRLSNQIFRIFSVILLAGSFASATPADIPAGRLIAEGRADEALRDLNQRVGANERDAASYNLLCRTYYSLEDWDGAIRACERSVQLSPNVSTYHLWLGRAYGRKAEFSSISAYSWAKKSVAAMQRAHALNPKDTHARRDLAEYYATAPSIIGGSREKALQLADEVSNSDQETAAWIRGLVAGKQSNFAEAERQQWIAIHASGNSAEMLLNLARLYRKQKRWNDFESTVERAMASQKRDPSDLFDAGEMLTLAGRNLNGAVRILRNYLSGSTDEVGPSFRAHYLIGQALEKTGDKQGAIREYRAALARASSYHPAQDALRHLGAR